MSFQVATGKALPSIVHIPDVENHLGGRLFRWIGLHGWA
jgi:hypothetical protein